MKSVDFQDSFYKLPLNERLQQQRQQQPIVNQDINQQAHHQTVQSNIDTAQQMNESEQAAVEKDRRDREFRQRMEKKKKEKKEKRPRSNSSGRIVDLEG